MEQNKEKTTNTQPKRKARKKKYRIFRRIARVMLGILVFLLLLILFIRSPWGQGIIVDKVVSYVSDKTNTKVEIEKLFITFDGDIMLKGLFLEDKKGDTLVYSKSLEADVPLWPIIRGNGIGLESVDWEGLRANIIRKDSVAGYNFQFLIDAFAAEDITSVTADTTSAPMNIIIGDLNFEDFDVVYNDAVLGIDSRFIVGELELEMEKTDLENMDFRASDGVIKNSRIQYVQNPVPPAPPADVPLPFLAIDELTIENVFATYQDHVQGLSAEVDLVDFYAEVPKLDLANQDFEIGTLELNKSIVAINMKSNTEEAVVKEENNGASESASLWPNLLVAIDEIDFSENNISYSIDGAEPVQGTFNANAISISNLELQASDISLKNKTANLNLEKLSFQEASGNSVHKAEVRLVVTDTNMKVSDLSIAANNSSLSGNATLQYASLNSLIDSPETTKANVNIPSFKVALQDVFQFQPDLKNNEYLKTASKRPISGNINAKGVLSALQIPSARVNWGKTTYVSATATLYNVTDPEKLSFDVPSFMAETVKKDLVQFVSEEELGVQLPKDILLKGVASGTPEDISANANVTTSQGVATLEGNFKNTDEIAFNADFNIQEYNIGELLQDEQFGKLSLTASAKGKGTTINTLDATAEVVVDSFQLNDYKIKDLKVSGNVKNGKGDIVSKYKDKNLNLDLNASVVLDSVAPEASLDLHLIGADLEALGIMDRYVRAGMQLNADFVSDGDSFDVISTIGDGVIVYDDKSYLLGSLLATAHVSSDTTSIWVDNKMLNLTLESNTDPQRFSTAIQKHIGSYFSRKPIDTDTVKNPVDLTVEGTIRQSPVLNEVFLVNVKDMDTIDLSLDFKEKERRLTANILAPHINYGGNELDSLKVSMETSQDNFRFNAGFNAINAGPLAIQKTEIKGNKDGEKLLLDFLSYYEDEKLIQIQSEITGTSDKLRFHVNPDSLIIQKKPWTTPATNEMLLSESKIEFNEFRFSRNNQSLEFTDKLPNEKDHVGITFENFKLSEFLNYLNPEETLATGILNGQVVFEDIFGSTGLVADVAIKQLSLLDVNLGTLSVDAGSTGGNSYDFNAALKEGAIDMDITGDYVATTETPNLNLDIAINEFKMKALEGFSQGEITQADGSFSGAFTLNGTLDEPEYKGNIEFTNADFKIAKLNAAFTLADEELTVDNKGLAMDNFTIADENGNTFSASGNVGTENFINPTFDLQLKAKNFQVLNATEDDNDFLYGIATFDADAKLTGDLQIPVLKGSLTVGSNTDVTYIMPSATVNIEERDGVVIFVNRENPDAILTRTEEQTATVTGFDISANLNIGKEAQVKIIIDQETGDNFQVSGEGEFNFTMNPNGRMNLSGVYEVTDGHYEMNLYNLVNRKFKLDPSSRITWSGDPFDAELDVRAIYDVEASASPLMASQTSGADPSIKNKYRQVLPFYVYLNVDGELMQPKISFNLDMPEDEQGSVGGQVYGRIQQLNQQENELNKQVFSLLVLNRFYPEPGSDGSRGGAASIARDNLNDALSDQLNVFSDKLLGDTGVELDFGLDSYTDYQGNSPQERTQLDIAARKKLFNDRLIVSVGSEVDIQGSSSTGEPAPLIGNVSLEYILTENGRYRLKGFRRNEFENVIDGQTIVSGIALIFTQEFNEFKDLWDAMLRSQSQDEEDSEKETKEKEKAKRTKETEEEQKNNK
nr:translocation/assembly module TamB domain-containing protein [Marixanthomonas ophiurae]